MSEHAANVLYFVGGVATIVGIVIGLAGAVLTVWADGMRDKYAALTQSDNELRIADANDSAARANEGLAQSNLAIEDRRKENLELEIKLVESQAKVAELLRVNKEIANKMVSRADALTYEKRGRLLEKLKALPPKSVWITRDDPNAESREFADVLRDLLETAGCFAGEATMDDVSRNRNSPGRVVIQPMRDSVRFHEIAAVLAEGLIEAGIPDVTVDPSPPIAMGERGTCQLLIKPK